MAFGQVVTHVTAGQSAAGADKASQHLNQINANAQFDSANPKVVQAPTPTAPDSLQKAAQHLADFNTYWNQMCEEFKWSAASPQIAATSGGRKRTMKTKKNNRKKNVTKKNNSKTVSKKHRNSKRKN